MKKVVLLFVCCICFNQRCENWESVSRDALVGSFFVGAVSEVVIQFLFYLKKKYPELPEIIYPRDRVLVVAANSGYQLYNARNLIIEDLKSATSLNVSENKVSLSIKFDDEKQLRRLLGLSTFGTLAGAALVYLGKECLSKIMSNNSDSA